MLSFQEQEKVLKPILERETNKHCADCGSHTPTCIYCPIQGHPSTSGFLSALTVQEPIEPLGPLLQELNQQSSINGIKTGFKI